MSRYFASILVFSVLLCGFFFASSNPAYQESSSYYCKVNILYYSAFMLMLLFLAILRTSTLASTFGRESFSLELHRVCCELALFVLALLVFAHIGVKHKGMTNLAILMPFLYGSLWVSFWALLSICFVFLGLSVHCAAIISISSAVVLSAFPFWIAPWAARTANADSFVSVLFYVNPLFFLSQIWKVDLLRLPSFYVRTPISQMFVRYPDSRVVLMLWAALCMLVLLTASLAWRKKRVPDVIVK